MKYSKIFYFAVLFVSVNIIAQTNEAGSGDVNLGIMEEVSFISYNTNTDKNESGFYPVSFYLSGRVHATRELSLEFRPGFIFGGEEYTGFEYGFFLRYRFYQSKIYLIGGINFHDNMGDAHGVNPCTYISDDFFTLANLSVGYNLSDNFSLLLSYYHPVKDYTVYTESYTEQSGQNIYTLQNIIKLGIDYTF